MITRIAVCGLGKLGSCIAVSFAKAGLEVFGYDINKECVRAFNVGKLPVHEPDLQETFDKCRANFSATIDPAIAVRTADACIFVTQTPSLPDGSFDNQYLIQGIEKVAKAVGGREFTFIIASTVTPSSCDTVFLPLIRTYCPHAHLVYKPELIALGTVMHDLAAPDVSLIGSYDAHAGADVLHLYAKLQPWISNKTILFKIMAPIEAELAKISLNCAITMKISFANQVGMVARRYGANPNAILDFVGLDSRIGKKCLKFGMPYGGPCFPRDNRMFQHVANKVGVSPHLAIATDYINSDLISFFADSVSTSGDIGILGLSYKANAAFFEESAGNSFMRIFTQRGRKVFCDDPRLHGNSQLTDAARCQTVIITLDAPEYRCLQFEESQTIIDPLGVLGRE